MLTANARCTTKIKRKIGITKTAFRRNGSSPHKQLAKNIDKKESHENILLVSTTIRMRGMDCEQGDGQPATKTMNSIEIYGKHQIRETARVK